MIAAAGSTPVRATVVAKYLFDEGSGTVAVDSSGNGNDGTIVGSTYTNDTPFAYVDNCALEFYGEVGPLEPADCYVTITDAPSLRPQSQGTVEAWIKTTYANHRWNSHIVTKQFGQEQRDSYALWNASSEHIFFWVETSSWFVYAPIPPFNEWHHVAGVWDDSTVSLYIDGDLKDSVSRSGPIPYDDNPVLIGADDNNADNIPDEVWNGVIDEVIIHDRALTAQEVYESATKSTGPGSTNTAPAANSGPDQTLEGTSPAGASVTLDGSGSSDPDSTPGTNNDIEFFDWYEGGTLLGSGEAIDRTLSLGRHIVTLVVTDISGETDSDEVIVVVEDTAKPAINKVTATPNVLWPPSHEMVEVAVELDAEDICDPEPVSYVLGVTSNEPINGPGDGNTEPDFEYTEDPLVVVLRAERAGSGAGRTYTIIVQCVDAAGNISSATVDVIVPHSRGKGKK